MVKLKTSAKKFISIAVFGIAMAYLEAAVVVYLRMLFYPEGSLFPLKIMPLSTILIELGRELSTIVMLLVIGYLSGKDFSISFFVLVFGIFSITYGLKYF
jgi:hypothetical protein